MPSAAAETATSRRRPVTTVRAMPLPPAVALAIDHLDRLVVEVPDRLMRVAGTTATLRPQPGRWSKKEILGHLIDSAVNNLQRFVLLQQEATVRLPIYNPDRWVGIQRHRARNWRELVDEWVILNRHLLHVLHHVDPLTLHHVWIDGDNATLSFLIIDYVAHLREHLQEIAPEEAVMENQADG
jgi:hypothetical protein